MLFDNRVEAGKRLASLLSKYRKDPNAVVLGVPRGGVVPAFEVARELELPLDIVLTKKIGHPDNPEYAIGAVGIDGTMIQSGENVPAEYYEKEAARIRRMLLERRKDYLNGREPIDLKGKTLIVIDDGVATGKTLMATLMLLRKHEPLKIVVAVPVAPADTIRILKTLTEEVVCLMVPADFRAIGYFYRDFTQVPDEVVRRLLDRAAGQPEQKVMIPVDGVVLEGMLCIPRRAKGVVIFSHGSGSSHRSPRNRMVAEKLQSEGIGTLLFDLLTPEEDEIRRNRFDIMLLTKRLVACTGWLQEQMEGDLPLGYFGASTGAASALRAASVLSNTISALVSRGGRPDLAMEVLSLVNAPVLLIVGENDREVLELNDEAFWEIGSERKEMCVVPGAGHLFGEPGKLEEVARISAEWFTENFSQK